MISTSVDTGVAAQRHTGLHTGGMNLLDAAVQMQTRFLMHIHDGSAAIANLRDPFLRLDNHQMHIERLGADFRQRFHH